MRGGGGGDVVGVGDRTLQVHGPAAGRVGGAGGRAVGHARIVLTHAPVGQGRDCRLRDGREDEIENCDQQSGDQPEQSSSLFHDSLACELRFNTSVTRVSDSQSWNRPDCNLLIWDFPFGLLSMTGVDSFL